MSSPILFSLLLPPSSLCPQSLLFRPLSSPSPLASFSGANTELMSSAAQFAPPRQHLLQRRSSRPLRPATLLRPSSSSLDLRRQPRCVLPLTSSPRSSLTTLRSWLLRDLQLPSRATAVRQLREPPTWTFDERGVRCRWGVQLPGAPAAGRGTVLDPSTQPSILSIHSFSEPSIPLTPLRTSSVSPFVSFSLSWATQPLVHSFRPPSPFSTMP